MLDLGLPELLIILGILVLFFGANRLPKLSRSIGESARELRKGLSDATAPVEKLKQTPKKTTSKRIQL